MDRAPLTEEDLRTLNHFKGQRSYLQEIYVYKHSLSFQHCNIKFTSIIINITVINLWCWPECPHLWTKHMAEISGRTLWASLFLTFCPNFHLPFLFILFRSYDLLAELDYTPHLDPLLSWRKSILSPGLFQSIIPILLY
jgi:hypothetical protein